MNEAIPDQEAVRALERARGLCEACKAGAGMTVRRRKDGSWVRFATAVGRWLDTAGRAVDAYHLTGLHDETVKLATFRCPQGDKRTRFAGRVVVFCLQCVADAGNPLDPPRATPPENLELW